jgi:hypothetical protein
MSGHANPISKEELWGGGQSPFSISYGKMMMWYFLVSDALYKYGIENQCYWITTESIMLCHNFICAIILLWLKRCVLIHKV